MHASALLAVGLASFVTALPQGYGQQNPDTGATSQLQPGNTGNNVPPIVAGSGPSKGFGGDSSLKAAQPGGASNPGTLPGSQPVSEGFAVSAPAAPKGAPSAPQSPPQLSDSKMSDSNTVGPISGNSDELSSDVNPSQKGGPLPPSGQSGGCGGAAASSSSSLASQIPADGAGKTPDSSLAAVSPSSQEHSKAQAPPAAFGQNEAASQDGATAGAPSSGAASKDAAFDTKSGDSTSDASSAVAAPDTACTNDNLPPNAGHKQVPIKFDTAPGKDNHDYQHKSVPLGQLSPVSTKATDIIIITDDETIIIDLEGVTCQAFSDPDGKQQVGNDFSADQPCDLGQGCLTI